MQRDLNKIHSGLKNKGFQIEKDGDDFYCRYFTREGIMTKVRTKCGGHSKKKYKSLTDTLIFKIYRSLHFDNKGQFADFIDCPFSQGDYQSLLTKKGKLHLL